MDYSIQVPSKGIPEEQLTVEDISEEVYKIEDLLKMVEREVRKITYS